jgi:MurNAc alpha-1-phosphate uridylyltransferase
MVLAAGRGERMRPLSDHRPKPLLTVQGKPLMQWPIEALARAGLPCLLVNTAWLGEQISDHFGAQFQLPGGAGAAASIDIIYSHEGLDFGGALETAGGIARALPRLAEVFWVVAGDVLAPDFVFSPEAVTRFAAGGKLAHLWLVPNPAHKPDGDFGLNAQGLALNQAELRFTYSTIGLYRQALFAPPFCDIPPGNPQGLKAPLAPLLRAAIAQGRVSAELYTGAWADVGTPERLAALNQPDA